MFLSVDNMVVLFLKIGLCFRQYHTKIPLETRQQIINYESGLDLW